MDDRSITMDDRSITMDDRSITMDDRSITMDDRSPTPGPEMVPDHLLDGPDLPSSAKRLIMAVDFGTTYSAIAYVALEDGQSGDYLAAADIRTIQNYPDDATFGALNDEMRSEVPTEVIYPSNNNFRVNEGMSEGSSESEHQLDNPPASREAARDGQGEQSSSSNRLAVFGSDQYDHDTEEMSVDEDNTFRWGYGAHEAWASSSTHVNSLHAPLARFKLLLDDSPKTAAVRDELSVTINKLKKKKIIIQDHREVIVDFLTCLLRHAKSELQSAGYDDNYNLEMVLCVPAIWTQKACRIMQTAMAKAMRQAGLPGVDEDNSIKDLFIVSEPEAAAAFVLAESRDISVWHSGHHSHTATHCETNQGLPRKLTSRTNSPETLLCCWMQVLPNSSLAHEVMSVIVLTTP
jgi:hypothetical protein